MKEGYYHTKESVEEYIDMAKDVNGEKLIETLKLFLPLKTSILELGTGPGTDWNILNKDFKVTGSDNSLQFLSHLKEQNPQGAFVELDATTLKTEEQFDCIYSNKVLHHLNDDELIVSIKRQYEILNPGGIVSHSFWQGTGTEIFKGLFVNYHSINDLKDFFYEYFEILRIDEYQEFDENDSLLLIGRKK